jgi:nucleotide-binding universal stress UspA family protein
VFLALYQFRFQPVAWYVTIGWIVLGLLIYFAYSEKQAVHEMPQVLVPGAVPAEIRSGYSVLVPLSNPDTVNVLIDTAAPIAREHRGHIVALAVVNVPRQLPVHEGLRYLHHKDRLFRLAHERAKRHGVDVDTEVVIAHHVHDGILSAARRLRADLLLMGWKGYTNTRDRLFGEVADHVIRHAPCDLMLLKIRGDSGFRNALLPTAGGPHARLAAEYLGILARARQMTVTACYVVPPEASQVQRDDADLWIDKTLARLDGGVAVDKKLIESGSVAGGIAKAGRDFDLVVLGAAKEPLFRPLLVGEIAAKAVRSSPTSVMLVKRYEGTIKSLLKRILG